jgi:hypothetical protein
MPEVATLSDDWSIPITDMLLMVRVASIRMPMTELLSINVLRRNPEKKAYNGCVTPLRGIRIYPKYVIEKLINPIINPELGANVLSKSDCLLKDINITGNIYHKYINNVKKQVCSHLVKNKIMKRQPTNNTR